MKDLTDNQFIEGKLILELYVTGMSAKSTEAIQNIKHICDDYLKGAFQLKIVDLYKHPEAASKQQIIFSPSLIKKFPLPMKTLVGTFSDPEKVLKGLGLTINR